MQNANDFDSNDSRENSLNRRAIDQPFGHNSQSSVTKNDQTDDKLKVNKEEL